MGEFWVRQELKKLDSKKYIILHDVMISDSSGTHQIDHIIFSNYGIFVVETKNYYGLIKGKEYDNMWLQYLGKHKSYFLNPIHQNFGHIKALSNILKISEENFISIICFSNQATLNITSKSVITQIDYLGSEIRKFKEIKNGYDISLLVNNIKQNNITAKKDRLNHINRIQDKLEQDKYLESEMICPKCHNKLVQKNSKFGTFMGCSNYPKCRYIKK